VFQTEMCELKLTQAMPAIAEVALLCVLRHLRRHPYQESFNINIYTQPVSDQHGEHSMEEPSWTGADEDDEEAAAAHGMLPQGKRGHRPAAAAAAAAAGGGKFVPGGAGVQRDARYEEKNLYKSQLATQAALALLRRLNIVYDQNRKTGIVIVKGEKLKAHFGESAFGGGASGSGGYRSGLPQGSMLRDQQRDIRLGGEHYYLMWD